MTKPRAVAREDETRINMKILITGGGGQLAWELNRSAPASAELLYTNSEELDITDAEAVRQAVAAAHVLAAPARQRARAGGGPGI